MKIKLMCICGCTASFTGHATFDYKAESIWEMLRTAADRWRMDHAKCRKVTRVLTPGPDGVIGKVNIGKLPRRKPNPASPDDQEDHPDPAKECEHMYPSNQGVPRCVRCGKEIGT